MTTRTARLDVTGMSCANCASTIEDRVGELGSVSDVDSNYATDEATVEYDPEQTTLADIYDAVADAGYEAVSESSPSAARICRVRTVPKLTRTDWRGLLASSARRSTTPPTRHRSATIHGTRRWRTSTTLSRTQATPQ